MSVGTKPYFHTICPGHRKQAKRALKWQMKNQNKINTKVSSYFGFNRNIFSFVATITYIVKQVTFSA